MTRYAFSATSSSRRQTKASCSGFGAPDILKRSSSSQTITFRRSSVLRFNVSYRERQSSEPPNENLFIVRRILGHGLDDELSASLSPRLPT